MTDAWREGAHEELERRMNPSNLLSMSDLSRHEIQEIFQLTDFMRMSHQGKIPLLTGKVICTLFFESSIRTRLSFEAAAYRLGANIIGVNDLKTTRQDLGEKLEDMTRMAGYYSDLVVVRHSTDGVMRLIEETIDVPLISAGEGTSHHPTQTLIDLYTIQDQIGSINNINIGMIGGVRYSRAAKSLLQGLDKFERITIHFIESESLGLDDDSIQILNLDNVKIMMHKRIEDLLTCIDVLYVVRVQRERFTDDISYASALKENRIDRRRLTSAKSNLIVMHCLPRTDELAADVDRTSQNKYFAQASHGVPVRMAVLATLLSPSIPEYENIKRQAINNKRKNDRLFSIV